MIEYGIVTKCYKQDNGYAIEYKPDNPFLFWKRRLGHGFTHPFRINSKIKVLLDEVLGHKIVAGAKYD